MGKLLLITSVFLVGLGALFLITSNRSTQISEIHNAVATETFTGKITSINNGCWADGFCSITVDGSKHVLGQAGGFRSPKEVIVRGESEINFSQGNSNLIGKRVEVFAKVSENNRYTIYGSEDYYIRLLGE